jgi:hypothetical protein
VKQPDYSALRKRVLMFYFAAGVNLLMALYVVSAGGAIADRTKVWIIAIVFLAFGGLNYYMARVLTKRWNAQVRQQRMAPDANGDGQK